MPAEIKSGACCDGIDSAGKINPQLSNSVIKCLIVSICQLMFVISGDIPKWLYVALSQITLTTHCSSLMAPISKDSQFDF